MRIEISWKKVGKIVGASLGIGALVALAFFFVFVFAGMDRDISIPSVKRQVAISDDSDTWSGTEGGPDARGAYQLLYAGVDDGGTPQIYSLRFNRAEDGPISLSSVNEERLGNLSVSPGCYVYRLTPSPDKRYIAFTVLCGAGHNTSWVVESDGSHPTKIESSHFLVVEDWFPSEDNLLLRGANISGLWVAKVNGTISHELQIPNAKRSISDVALSPDGHALVYSAHDGMWRYNLDDQKRWEFAEEGIYGTRNIIWSPDGTKVAFVKVHSEAEELWLANADGTAQRLVHRERKLGWAEWSPDSSSLAFVKKGTPEGDSVWLHEIDIASSKRVFGLSKKRILGIDYPSLSWSPDGALLTFVANEDDDSELWVVDVKTGIASQLKHISNQLLSSPVWFR